MTRNYSQSDLDHMNETELRLKLRQMFNELAGLQASVQEYSLALATLEEMQRALRRRLNSFRP